MNKIIAIVVGLALISLSTISSGCASALVYRNSSKKLQDRAIRAVPVEDGVGIGIDVTALNTLREQPLLQTGAAILDALAIYATYDYVENKLDNSSSGNRGDSRENVINVSDNTGNVNINISGDSSSESADSSSPVVVVPNDY